MTQCLQARDKTNCDPAMWPLTFGRPQHRKAFRNWRILHPNSFQETTITRIILYMSIYTTAHTLLHIPVKLPIHHSDFHCQIRTVKIILWIIAHLTEFGVKAKQKIQKYLNFVPRMCVLVLSKLLRSYGSTELTYVYS